MRRLLFMAAFMPCLLFTSCSSDKEEDNGSSNTTDVAVTGTTDEVGFSYAVVNGYANLSLLSSATSSYDMGIEYAEDEAFDDYHRERTDKLVGTKISVYLEELTPETQYYYRTFVYANGIYNYGQTKTFTTKTMPQVGQTDIVTDVTPFSATVKCQLNLSGIASKESYYVGVAYATDKQELHQEGNSPRLGMHLGGEEDEPIWIGDPVQRNGNTLTVTLTGLQPSTTVYYCAYTSVGGATKYGDIKSLTTESAEGALMVDDATDVTMHRATITGTTCIGQYTSDYVYYRLLYVPESWGNPTLDERSGNFYTRDFYPDGDKFWLYLEDLEGETTYYYRVVADFNGMRMETPVKRFTTKGVAKSGAVDLGLSVKWAACNLGAESPDQTGNYYAWGETSPKDHYAWENYRYLDDNQQYIDIGSDISGTQYDAARQQLGSSWRMPTMDEARELAEKCQLEWTYYQGTAGYQVTGPNGNVIFMPSVGMYDYNWNSGVYYWTGQQCSDWSAYYLNVWSVDNTGRPCGLPIRPVRD